MGVRDGMRIDRNRIRVGVIYFHVRYVHLPADYFSFGTERRARRKSTELKFALRVLGHIYFIFLNVTCHNYVDADLHKYYTIVYVAAYR